LGYLTKYCKINWIPGSSAWQSSLSFGSFGVQISAQRPIILNKEDSSVPVDTFWDDILRCALIARSTFSPIHYPLENKVLFL
jgi:hypothetical protein